jgi:hypothetical protein
MHDIIQQLSEWGNHKMNKRVMTIVIAMVCGILAAVALVLVLLLVYKPPSQNIAKNTILQDKVINEADSSFNITAALEVKNERIIIKEDLILKKASDNIIIYIPSDNNATTNVKNVLANGGFINISRRESTLELECKNSVDKVHIEYEIILENIPSILSYSKDRILLTNFLMTPSLLKDGKVIPIYKYSFGDPYIYDINNYNISVQTSQNLTVFAPGKTNENVSAGIKTTKFVATNMRDFPIVILDGMDVQKEKSGNITIYYIGSKGTNENVKYALKYAAKNIGPYPYKELFIVKTPMVLEGMEFSNMIFLSDKCFDDLSVLKRVTYHEILHQWFYGIIGTDQLNEPFFDEGMVEYLAKSMCNDNLNDSFNEQFLKMGLSDYTKRDEYYAGAYNNSSLYFSKMSKSMGNNFFKLLQRVYKDKMYSTIYFSEFLNYARQLGFK